MAIINNTADFVKKSQFDYYKDNDFKLDEKHNT